MRDARRVCRRHAIGDLHRDIEQLLHRHRPALHNRSERLAWNQFADNVEDTAPTPPRRAVRRCSGD